MAEKHSNVVLNFKMNGQVQYAQSLKQINMVMQTASKEYQNHVLAIGKDAAASEKLAAEKKKLETQLAASAQKVAMLSKEFAEMQNDTSATADDLQKLYNQLLSAENAHTKLENSMKRVSEGLTKEAVASQSAKEELKQLNNEVSVLESEQKKLSSSFDLQNATLSKNANEAERAALAQQQFAQQVAHTERYVKTLENQLDAARRAYGENSREVNQLESKLNGAKTTIAKFNTELESVEDSSQKAEKGINGLQTAISGLAGVVAGVSIAKIFNEALSVSDLNTRIDIAFNVNEESKESVRQAMADVQKYGIDIEESFEGVRRQWALNGEATDAANAIIVEGAAAITKAYSRVDFVELIQEVNEISGELEIADEEALNLVNDLLKIGFPDEQIDTIAEYGQQLKRAGYEANEIKAIMASAVATDSWNIDNLLDGLKEGRIVAAEMANGLSDGFKDAIAEVTSNTRKMTDEQIDTMKDSLKKQEDALKKSLSKQYSEAKKGLDKQEKAYQKSLDRQLKAAEKSMNRQQKELEKSLDAEMKAYEKVADKKIKLIDKEYTERLKLIDEERYNAIKAVENEIKSIEDLMTAEERSAEEVENSRKRSELQLKVNASKTNKERQQAERALAEFENDIRMKQLQQERKDQIETLKEQKDGIKDLYDGKKEEIQSEYDLAKERAKESIDVERESLKERQQLEKESFTERKSAYLENVRERHASELESFREMNDAKLEQMQEMNNKELERVQEINAAKIEAAKKPPESALYTETIKQLEAWGKAIAEGGKEGSKAYSDMVKWLDDIDDATLRNVIGTEVFKTKWEDQGENIIESILGIDDALVELEKTQTDVGDTVEQINNANALVRFNDAINRTKIALEPLLANLAKVIGTVSKFAAENPKLTSSIVGVISAVGIIAGAFAGLAPIVYTVTSLFGAEAGGAGLLATIKNIMPVITNLASKVLPLLGRAFGLLSGPIGWVITALTIAVPLIIKHWEPISEFFSNLFSGIWEFFQTFGSNIIEFFREWGPNILAVLTGPLGLLIKFIIENWELVKKVTTQIFSNVLDFFITIFRKIYDNTIGRIIRMKNDVADHFEGMREAIITPIEKARDVIKRVIDTIKSFFDFEFKWPELKVPKLQISKGSLNPLRWFDEGFPEIDVKWFAKGGIMTRPTVFGASGNSLYAGGEAGDEAILPLNEKTLGAIGKAIADTMNLNDQQGDIVLNFTAELDGAVVAKKTKRYMNRELFGDFEKDMRGR